jgi:hypothetical protein
MIRGRTNVAVEAEAFPRLLRVFLLLSAISAAVGLTGACISFTSRNYEHISTLFPELQHLDSVYIESRGFPFAQWVKNDPARSGCGDARSAFLPSGVLANGAFYGVLAFFVVTPLWVLVWFVAYRRGRTGDCNVSLNERG